MPKTVFKAFPHDIMGNTNNISGKFDYIANFTQGVDLKWVFSANRSSTVHY